MSKKTNATKTGSLSNAFLSAARADEDGALAYMLMSSFGVMLSTLLDVAERAITNKHLTVIVMCLTAGTQIRANVTFVQGVTAEIKRTYPELIIDSDRSVGDIYNFGALHALGHIFAHLTRHALGLQIISKAGSCITGERSIDSDAGAINKEIASSWSAEDKALFNPWRAEMRPEDITLLDDLCGAMEAKASAFRVRMSANRTG